MAGFPLRVLYLGWEPIIWVCSVIPGTHCHQRLVVNCASYQRLYVADSLFFQPKVNDWFDTIIIDNHVRRY